MNYSVMATAAEIAAYMAWKPDATVLWLIREPEDRRLAAYYLKDFLAQPLHIPGHASIPGMTLSRSNISEIVAENGSRTFVTAVLSNSGKGRSLDRAYVPHANSLDARRARMLEEFMVNMAPTIACGGSIIRY